MAHCAGSVKPGEGKQRKCSKENRQAVLISQDYVPSSCICFLSQEASHTSVNTPSHDWPNFCGVPLSTLFPEDHRRAMPWRSTQLQKLPYFCHVFTWHGLLLASHGSCADYFIGWMVFGRQIKVIRSSLGVRSQKFYQAWLLTAVHHNILALSKSWDELSTQCKMNMLI